jgi:Family of unknown function (DUF5895)
MYCLNMVKSNSSKRARREEEQIDFNIDSELLDPTYNETRRPSLPYGIIINASPAGIMIPSEQLEKAEWIESISPEQQSTIELTEEVTGLFISKCRMIVLACVPEYVRYKDIEENGERSGSFVSTYDDYRYNLNKKTQDVCSEHAVVFLDRDNQPLHRIPIVIRFKNVALWSFKAAKETFYRALEKVFAEYFDVPYSGKNDKWRSLGVLNVQFQAHKEGEGKNRSFCCKTEKIIAPTINNFPKLFLGHSDNKKIIWNLHSQIAGFISPTEGQLPALASSERPEVELLPPETASKTNLRRISSSEYILDENELEAEEYDEFDFNDVD